MIHVMYMWYWRRPHGDTRGIEMAGIFDDEARFEDFKREQARFATIEEFGMRTLTEEEAKRWKRA
jgi:hypothetical protein